MDARAWAGHLAHRAHKERMKGKSIKPPAPLKDPGPMKTILGPRFVGAIIIPTPSKKEAGQKNIKPLYDKYDKSCKFAIDYVKNNTNVAHIYHKRRKYQYLSQPLVINLIIEVIDRMAGEHIMSYEYKLEMLKKLAETCARQAEENDKNNRAANAVSALELANKMQGHTAPTATDPVIDDEQRQKAKAIMAEYDKKYTKDY